MESRARNGNQLELVGKNCWMPKPTCKIESVLPALEDLFHQAQSPRTLNSMRMEQNRLELSNDCNASSTRCNEISFILICADEGLSAVDWRYNGPRKHKSIEYDGMAKKKAAALARICWQLFLQAQPERMPNRLSLEPCCALLLSSARKAKRDP
uniref:Uncharacterized protein n=1 Tax=Rhodosorus marinus TaxID=101924 RepID=A0A7S0BSH6_9RHOD|mmetsp:Transcript_7317/g.10922  ORF Transcript_7317/g.10922 Transcript_7317/m.10922 type:complete len:154 (+) Transcript_7317:82-543(+)